MSEAKESCSGETVDISGLPPDSAALVRQLVRALRSAGPPSRPGRPSAQADFATWSGGIVGRLTRSEIYEDVA